MPRGWEVFEHAGMAVVARGDELVGCAAFEDGRPKFVFSDASAMDQLEEHLKARGWLRTPPPETGEKGIGARAIAIAAVSLTIAGSVAKPAQARESGTQPYTTDLVLAQTPAELPQAPPIFRTDGRRIEGFLIDVLRLGKTAQGVPVTATATPSGASAGPTAGSQSDFWSVWRLRNLPSAVAHGGESAAASGSVAELFSFQSSIDRLARTTGIPATVWLAFDGPGDPVVRLDRARAAAYDAAWPPLSPKERANVVSVDGRVLGATTAPALHTDLAAWLTKFREAEALFANDPAQAARIWQEIGDGKGALAASTELLPKLRAAARVNEIVATFSAGTAAADTTWSARLDDARRAGLLSHDQAAVYDQMFYLWANKTSPATPEVESVPAKAAVAILRAAQLRLPAVTTGHTPEPQLRVISAGLDRLQHQVTSATPP